MRIKVTYRLKKSGLSMRVTKKGDVNVSAPWGTPEHEVKRFIEQNREWIESARQRIMAHGASREAFFDRLPLATAAQCDEASRRLNSIIPPLICKYQPLMGVSVAGISYRRSKTRWGSCNHRTRRLNFSAYVLLLPEWCIEHIVVHEMAHLLVPNHSRDFYAVMDRYFPRWREARAEAKRLSNLEDPDDDI